MRLAPAPKVAVVEGDTAVAEEDKVVAAEGDKAVAEGGKVVTQVDTVVDEGAADEDQREAVALIIDIQHKY